MIKLNQLLLIIFSTTLMFGQERTVEIWPNGIPNYKKTNLNETQKKDGILWVENVQIPTLEIFIPENKNTSEKGVVICPGGGYQGLAYDWEGTDIAKWFNSIGITAFVLKYRLPRFQENSASLKYPLQDAQRAIRWVRENSKSFNLSKIGIIGFSAGGHLASSVGTHYNDFSFDEISKIDSVNSRPDFMILVYPVISMKSSITHKGSRNNLIGTNPKNKLINFFSNELQVDKNTPPTFIVHAGDDNLVSVNNSLLFYQSLLKNGVKAELHIYPVGGHGFGLANNQPQIKTWTELLTSWLNKI